MNIAERFQARFQGLKRAYGKYYPVDEPIIPGTKVVCDYNHMVREEASPAAFKAHLQGEYGIRIIPVTEENTCYFGVIDIDDYSADFDIQEVVKKVDKLKLPLIVCRTKSGGAHLYLFLIDPLPASLVVDKLAEWSIALAYKKVEIFPKQIDLKGEKAYGNTINIPYFQGDKTTRYAYKGKKALSCREFLDYADLKSVSKNQLEEIKIELDVDEELLEAPPCLQQLLSKGGPGFPAQTRNNGMFNLAIYAKKKYGDEWEAKAELYNQTYLGKDDAARSAPEMAALLKQVNKKDYFYKCGEDPINSYCNKSLCRKSKFGIGQSNQNIGVDVSNLRRIKTTPPIWYIDVNGISVEVNNTDTLITLRELRKHIVEATGLLPNSVKAHIWEAELRALLDNVTEIDAPEEASTEGLFLLYVEEFCTEMAMGTSFQDILLGKPYEEDGYIYFSFIDLKKFLVLQKFDASLSTRAMWGILKRRLNADNLQRKIKGKNIKLWRLPSFTNIQTDEFDIPDTKPKEKF